MRALRRAGLLAAVLLALTSSEARAQQSVSRTAPWSERMAESVMLRNPVVSQRWDYTAGLVLLAVERVGETRRRAAMLRWVAGNMDRFVQPDGTIRTYRVEEVNLDQINQGRLLFPLLARSGDQRYRRAADLLREQLRRQPRTEEGGFWHNQIYPQQMWLDGLYMAEPFYAGYAVMMHDTAALHDVARQFLLTARHTRDARIGLLYHAWDAAHAQQWADSLTGQSPHVWGRAMGWYLMALVDVLDIMPPTQPDRPALLAVLRDAAEAVARVQDPVTGLWYQIPDLPSRTGNYLESSASSMFVYALARGADRRYLARSFRGVAERGFDGLVANLVTVDTGGLVTLNGVCQVAGLGGSPYRSGTFEYYVHEPVVANDYKGVGAFILAAQELGR